MRDQSGFSLVEVLVAGALLVVVLLAVAGMSLTAFGHLGRSGEQTSAAALGQQRVEWLRNQDWSSADLSAGTTTEVLAGTYAGFVRTTTVQDDTPRAGVKRLTVATTTPSGRGASVVALLAEP